MSADLLNAEVPDDWPKIVAMRNILAHQYAELDEQILQDTIDNRLDTFVDLFTRLYTAATQNEQQEAGCQTEFPEAER